MRTDAIMLCQSDSVSIGGEKDKIINFHHNFEPCRRSTSKIENDLIRIRSEETESGFTKTATPAKFLTEVSSGMAVYSQSPIHGGINLGQGHPGKRNVSGRTRISQPVSSIMG